MIQLWQEQPLSILAFNRQEPRCKEGEMKYVFTMGTLLRAASRLNWISNHSAAQLLLEKNV